MRRREFIRLFGSTAVWWPLGARAQQPNSRIRRVGALLVGDESNVLQQSYVEAFRQRLRELGWSEDRNVRIDLRWGGASPDRMRRDAAELAGQSPDVFFVVSNPGLAALLETTRTIPAVFVAVADPVGSGFIQSLSRPGGNITGFTNFESSMGSKWLEALHEIAPGVKRATIILHPETAAHAAFRRAADEASSSFGIHLTTAAVHDATEIKNAIDEFAQGSDGGLIVLPHIVTEVHGNLIIELAAQRRLPAVYPFRHFAFEGGLMSYGVNLLEAFRAAGSYVDHILREKPGELPVQAPTKFEMVINLKTAKALDLAVPGVMVARADEVIE
jgi:putative tryptophan/tyrosine transport system substrate-binding protein